MQERYYENYPLWITFLSNFCAIAIYIAGALVMYSIGWVWLLIYVLYIGWLEIRILRKSCVNCYYYGKVCAFGRGKLSRIFFKKGSSQQFCRTKITWIDILPDFLVSVIPIIAGIVLLIMDFNWLILTMVILLVLFISIGNGFVRGSLACRYCKQREIGCPAEQLFNRDRKKPSSES